MTREDRWRQFIDRALRKGKAVSATEMAVELYGGDSEAAVQAAKDTARECVEAGLLTNCRHYWHITVTEQGRAYVGEKASE
jgi:hypothetical protein